MEGEWQYLERKLFINLQNFKSTFTFNSPGRQVSESHFDIITLYN